MRFALYITACSLALMALPVQAQNINTMEARLDRMEREMQTLSRSVFKGDVPPPQYGRGSTDSMAADNTAAMELRLNQMEDSLRRLTGLIEEQGYQIRQLENKLNTGGDVPSDHGRSRHMTPESSSSSVTPPDNAPYRLGTLNADNAATSPAGLYDQAFSYLQTNDYAAAERSFSDFIDRYPDHSLAANAQYWLGETYYARQDYAAASRAFAKSFQDHPEGTKAPDTLLKLGMSLHQQGMKDEACLTLAELKKRFPNGPASVMKKADEETRTYSCD